MGKISEAEKQLRLNKWSEMYRSYRESGKTVLVWCRERDISPKTFYYRLRKVRESTLETWERHDIVPVQAAEINDVNVSETPAQQIVIRAIGIVAELPVNIPPETLSALIRGLRQC